jgi:hypothetical protein
MKNYSHLIQGLLWVLVGGVGASPLLAQDQNMEAPKPAVQYSPLFGATDMQQDANPGADAVQPDNRPLSGVQNPTVGGPETRHSYWVPAIQYGNASRSSSIYGTNSGWNRTNFLSTNLSFLESWNHSTLTANYSGGGYFSTDPVQGGQGDFQQLAANYQFDGKRWQAVLIDQFSYLPQSAFGFGGAIGGGLSTPGVSGTLAVPVTTLGPSYVPGQTNLGALGPQYSNSSAAQFTYKVSGRGSVTVAGVYGILRFVNPGNINNDMETGVVGYDYAVTRRDSLGVTYHFGAFRFPGDPQALSDQAVQLQYGRKITGRMALKLAGGPDLVTLRLPVGNLRRAISGTGSASLTYAFAKSSSIELHYLHGVTGGSGVFQGSNADQVGAGLAKQLTRVWNGNLSFGYARNGQILVGSSATRFDSWFAGAGLSRPIGHMTFFSLGYQAQIQSGSTVPGGGDYTVHQLYVSFQWHTRPFVLR